MGCDYSLSGTVPPAHLRAATALLCETGVWHRRVDLCDANAVVLRPAGGAWCRTLCVASSLNVHGVVLGVPTARSPFDAYFALLFDASRNGRPITLTPLDAKGWQWDSRIVDARSAADLPEEGECGVDYVMTDHCFLRTGSTWLLPLAFLAVRERLAPGLRIGDDYAITPAVERNLIKRGLWPALCDADVPLATLIEAYEHPLAGKQLARRWRCVRHVRRTPKVVMLSR